MAHGRPNSGQLVGRDRRSNTAAADEHSSLSPSIEQTDAQCLREVGIVDRVLGVGANVHDLVAPFAQPGREFLLQCESCVVRTDGFR